MQHTLSINPEVYSTKDISNNTDGLLRSVAEVTFFATTILCHQMSPLPGPSGSSSADIVTILSRLKRAADLLVTGSSAALC